jgi:hypothetical protein
MALKLLAVFSDEREPLQLISDVEISFGFDEQQSAHS